MAEFGVAAIGAGVALGGAVYTAATGFVARHEGAHSQQVTETRRHIIDFEAAYARGEVTEEDWQVYQAFCAKARQKESEYEDSIGAYKKTPTYKFVKKWRKRRRVRQGKKALQEENRSLRQHFYDSTSDASDTSSLAAASGSPPQSRRAYSDEDDKSILSWAAEVSNSDSENDLNFGVGLSDVQAPKSQSPATIGAPSKGDEADWSSAYQPFHASTTLGLSAEVIRSLKPVEWVLLAHLDRLILFLATARNSSTVRDDTPFGAGGSLLGSTGAFSDLNQRSIGAKTVTSYHRPPAALNRFPLPNQEFVTCVRWDGVSHITGMDIVRALVFRFEAFGRPVQNMKKFEEGVFRDLRNLDGRLEEAESPLLDFLAKHQCIRTQKKQKIFYWYSVPHDRLFLDALERDFMREETEMEPTTRTIREPALSFKYDTKRRLYEQFCKDQGARRGEGELDTAIHNLQLALNDLQLPSAVYLPKGSPTYKQQKEKGATKLGIGLEFLDSESERRSVGDVSEVTGLPRWKTWAPPPPPVPTPMHLGMTEFAPNSTTDQPPHRGALSQERDGSGLTVRPGDAPIHAEFHSPLTKPEVFNFIFQPILKTARASTADSGEADGSSANQSNYTSPGLSWGLTRSLKPIEQQRLADLDRLKDFLTSASFKCNPAGAAGNSNGSFGSTATFSGMGMGIEKKPAHHHADSHPALNRFLLPNQEFVTCVLWNELYHITGTDILRALVFRFEAFGRQVRNLKKFEEGVFNDLKSLTPGIDACLEDAKSPFLDFLFKYQCIRTRKKQKVFNWYSVPHDRLFLDALERDLKREKMGQEPTTHIIGEPALSFTYDSKSSLYEQFSKARREFSFKTVVRRTTEESTSADGHESGAEIAEGSMSDESENEVDEARSGDTDDSPRTKRFGSNGPQFQFTGTLFQGSPTYKHRRKERTFKLGSGLRKGRELEGFLDSGSERGDKGLVERGKETNTQLFFPELRLPSLTPEHS